MEHAYWIIVSSLCTRGPAAVRSVRCPSRRATATRRGVPLPAWGEARHSCTRARRAATTGRLEASPPTLPWRAAARAQFVRSTGRPTRPSVAASMKHRLRMHCPLVGYNFLVLTSVPDPIIYVSALDHSRCNPQRLRRLGGTCSVIMWRPQRRPPGRRIGHGSRMDEARRAAAQERPCLDHAARGTAVARYEAIDLEKRRLGPS